MARQNNKVSEKAPASRREREHEAHRQEIISVAETVFCANGFAGTTIEMVAKQADFSVGSIYNFFKGKKDLFRQVFLSVAEQRIQSMHEATAPLLDRPWEALRAFVGTWIAYTTRHGEFLRTAFSAVASGGTRNRPHEAPPPEFQRAFKGYRNELRIVCDAVLKAPDARHDLTLDEAAIVTEGIVREFLMTHRHDPETGIRLEKLPDDSADKLYALLCKVFRKEQP